MWKYVSRRLKETFDRTCNALDLCRTWRCGGGVQQNDSSQNEDSSSLRKCINYQVDENCVNVLVSPSFCVIIPKNRKSNGSSDGGQQERRGRKFQDDGGNQIHHDLLGAITWSGAIICGWYASQLLCLNRRHLGWDKSRQSQYFRILNTPARAVHTNLLSHYASMSPVQPSILSAKTLKENFDLSPSNDFTDSPNKVLGQFCVEVNDSKVTPESTSSDTLQKESVNEAVDNLVKFLGDAEFEMGNQYISVGQYRSAVKHLQLASKHHHTGATFNLGLCYEHGLGVTKNLKRAMECYQYASSMGHSKAMYNLGVFYAQGLGGLEKSRKAAHQCFIAAAKLGQNEAKTVLGWPVVEDKAHSITMIK